MKTTDKIIKVAPIHPEHDAIARAADILRSGGVVIVPTSGLYGLGADALNARAVERLFHIKGRAQAHPILVLIASDDMLARVATGLSAPVRAMMAHFWPGRITFVVPACNGLPPGLTAGTGKIGVRRVAHPVAHALVQTLGSPVTGTSANFAGAGGYAAVADIDTALIDAVDLVMDAGPLAGGPGSSVVDMTAERPRVIREGAVPAHEITAVFASVRPKPQET